VTAAGGSVISPFYIHLRTVFSIDRANLEARQGTNLIEKVVGLTVFTAEIAKRPLRSRPPPTVKAGQTFSE
jgi:hypothetical protein